MDSSVPLQTYHYDSVVDRKRRRLPHWITPFGIYFVTIHLRDAVPAALLHRWRADLDVALRNASCEAEAEECERKYIAKIEHALDDGHGSRHLADDRVASAVRDTFFHHDSLDYELLAWCIMPTHAHVVFRLLGRAPLDEVVKAWKSVSSRAAKRLLGLRSELWQEDYFDVLVRNNHHLMRATEYTLNNPAKAGLESWPWSGFNGERINQLL